MARFYKSGRSRTIRQRVTVSVNGTYRGVGSDASAGSTLLPGNDYAVTPASPTSQWLAYSSGFGVTPAYGEKVYSLGSVQRVVGIQVPSKTGNGFIPIALIPGGILGGTVSISADVVINRVMGLVEVFAHNQNGQRRDWFGEAGTCYETYTVTPSGGSSTTFTSRNEADMVPGQSPPALAITAPTAPFPVCFGFQSALTAVSGRTGFGGSGVAAESSLAWSVAYLNDAGDPIASGTIDAPPHSTTIGSSSWGSLVANAPTSGGKRTISVVFSWMPRHTFDVSMRPLEIPTAAPIVWPHRLEVDYINGPLTSTLYTTSGESVSIPAGGTRWQVTHSSTVAGDTSLATTYNSMLPIPSRFRVSTDNRQHFACRVLAPYNAISLSQAGALTLPGGAGTTIAAGATSTVSFGGQRIGYRYVRVRAKSPTGTGTLTIKSYLNSNTTDHTASKTLTTTVANTTETVEVDLLEVPGCTNDPRLYLEQLTFTATGANFTIETLELFRRDESVMQSLSPLRGIPPIETGLEVPWLRCFTDGVESLTMRATGGSLPRVNSLTVRQLVAEINGTTRHSYPGDWVPPSPFTTIDEGAAATPSPLLGWTAADSAPPRAGKDYGINALGELADFADSDVYVSALHGDGVIGSTLCLAKPAGDLQAQRFATFIEPGVLPGRCGFDGEAAGDVEEGGISFSCPIVFTALLRGLASGMIIPGGSLAVSEVSVTTGAGTTVHSPPIPRGRLVARASGYALGDAGLRGILNNGTIGGSNLDVFTNEVDNPGGTPTSASIEPYHRELVYDRFWLDAPSGEAGAICVDSVHGWLHVGIGANVRTYYARSEGALEVAFESPPWPGVERFVAMAYDPKRHELYLLAKMVVASTFALYRSSDGGKSGGEILTMTGNSGSIAVSSEHQALVVLIETVGGTVERQLSKDGGASWETPSTARSGAIGGSLSNLSAEVLSMSTDPRLGGTLFALIKTAEGAQKVLRSTTLGRQWEEVA